MLGSAQPCVAAAQANLSGQGLGYPTGQLSARALGTAGSIGEIDPMSPLNPAALGSIGPTTLFFQIEPEYRRVSTGTATDRTTTARYPLFFAAIPAGERWVFSLSSATLLDRSWSTTRRDTAALPAGTVISNFNYGSNGSINDLRLASSYQPRPWIRVGVGGHLMSGSDLVFQGHTFDSTEYASFADTSTLSFSGGALSAGLELIAPKLAVAAVSFRKGTELRASRGDTALGHAHVPDRLGLSLAYIGITNTEIAVRTSYDKWSSLSPLRRDTASALPVDAWDTSIGADVSGPHVGSHVLMLRVGGRWRTLPYEAAGNRVRERSLSAGFGTFLAGGRVSTDIAVVRAFRDAGLTVNERAWTLSIGLAVRP
ncbi:MAG TPA: hypothetical protein VJU87_08940 [Gemmatimonadaceae bacterium]|nr:hypothetical protein [Gemmatimonadaceae bacterium]